MGDDLDDSFTSMGAISALRTGNMLVDMLVAMCIPLFFKFVFGTFGDISARLASGDFSVSSLMFWKGKLFERVIEHKGVQNMWGDRIEEQDTRNNVLIKAILLYLDHRQMKWTTSRVSLTSMTHTERPWWCDDEDERSPAGKLKKYRLTQKAPNFKWQTLGVFRGGPSAQDGAKGQQAAPLPPADTEPAMVELRVEERDEDKGEKGEKTVSHLTYRFRSRRAAAIDGFIDEAYQWYLGELRKLEDNSRYLYEMQTGQGKSGDREPGVRTFKRYQLSDHKTFESLFFAEKQPLLSLLKHFQAKTGKYAIAGYPHKLGLLLHGPPGTGKTSLIKAMAQHTGRSIVNVPLARIGTNQELMDIMFDQQCMVEGEEVPIKLGFKDVIFVMEDVDAASKVVHRRDGKVTASVTRTEVIAAPKPKTAWQILLESDDEGCREVARQLMEKSARLKAAALSPASLCGVARQLLAPPGLGLLVGASCGDEGEDRRRREEARERVAAMCEDREAAQGYIRQVAGTLKALLDAGGTPDDALADELLGVSTTPSILPPMEKTTSIGFRGAVSSPAPKVDEKESESDGPAGEGGLDMMAAWMSMMGNPTDGDAAGDAGAVGSASAAVGSAFGPSIGAAKDKLNLSGLLNVLDGVVDTPERILIMTTNHPEQLDPALIRPGRIDKKILLAYMSPGHAASMIEHYFQCQLDAKQRGRVEAAISGSDERGLPALELTPAQIEQLAAEHDDVDDMIVALEEKAGVSSKRMASSVSNNVYIPLKAAGSVKFDH